MRLSFHVRLKGINREIASFADSYRNIDDEEEKIVIWVRIDEGNKNPDEDFVRDRQTATS